MQSVTVCALTKLRSVVSNAFSLNGAGKSKMSSKFIIYGPQTKLFCLNMKTMYRTTYFAGKV